MWLPSGISVGGLSGGRSAIGGPVVAGPKPLPQMIVFHLHAGQLVRQPAQPDDQDDDDEHRPSTLVRGDDHAVTFFFFAGGFDLIDERSVASRSVVGGTWASFTSFGAGLPTAFASTSFRISRSSSTTRSS